MSRIVQKPDKSKLMLRVGKASTEHLAGLLAKDTELFIADVGRRVAWRTKKRFTELVGRAVLAYPATYDGKDGYYFVLQGAPEAST